MELVSSCGDHQPSSSAHGARGSPGLPWSYAAHRARGELGKRRHPEPSRIGAEVRSPSTVSFCRMQLLEGRLCRFGDRPYVGPPLDGYGWEDGPVQTKPFYAKSAFSAKENTFGFDFHLWTPPA